jgi:hypothetical protein
MPRLSSSPLIHFNKNISHHVECLANALVIDYADEGIILKKKKIKSEKNLLPTRKFRKQPMSPCSYPIFKTYALLIASADSVANL